MGIRVYEVEFLLRHLSRLNSLVDSIKKQIESIQNDGEDDAIYALMTNRNFDGMPASGRIQDKTANIALKGRTKDKRQALKELHADLNLVMLISDKMNIALRLLNGLERQIVKAKYYQGMAFKEIATATGKGKQKIQTAYKKALEKLSNTIKTEEFIMLTKILKGDF